MFGIKKAQLIKSAALLDSFEDQSEQQSEAVLIERSAKGDRVAYRVLVERYQSRIFGLAMNLLLSREDAEDLTQEVFVKAFLSLNHFQSKSSFYTWIYRIAYNMAIDFKRKVKRSGVSVEFDQNRIEAQGGMSGASGPSQELEKKEISGRIRRALGGLTENHRAVVVLREIDGMSYEEISKITGASKGTVMSRLHYARKRLQEELADLVGNVPVKAIQKE